jgi:hypothetical protein
MSEDVPVLAADAHVEHVPADPVAAEYGSWTFTRDLGTHLSRLLHAPVGELLIRTNPWDRRPCPKVTVYVVAVGEHRVEVTACETTRPLSRGPVDAYHVLLDGVPVEFERTYRERLEWELARAIWIAVTDREIAAQRAARTTDGAGAVGA